MIERAEHLRFARRSARAAPRRARSGGQDLDRDVAAERRVARAVDLAHPPAPSSDRTVYGPKRRPMSDSAGSPAMFARGMLRSPAVSRKFSASGARASRESTSRRSDASPPQPSRNQASRSGASTASAAWNRRSTRPSARASRPSSPLSSRRSQTFASCQSRFTVSGDTFSASAVSWTVSPPKNRSSTTWLFRSSTRSSARSASSSATRLGRAPAAIVTPRPGARGRRRRRASATASRRAGRRECAASGAPRSRRNARGSASGSDEIAQADERLIDEAVACSV